MFVPPDTAGAGDPYLGGMKKNDGLSAASTSTAKKNGSLCAASTSTARTSVGGEWRPRSPVPTDPPAPEQYHDLADFYLEAARRLPIADIPWLANCISNRGLVVGLADPVSNIILTTINAFAKIDRPYCAWPVKDALEKTAHKTTFATVAHCSRNGLVKFLQCYFRGLTVDQAMKCLDVAGHDLRLAVFLVEAGCRHGSSEVPPLRPDAARTKTALQLATKWTKNDAIVRLMTWRYPRHLLDPVLDDLRGGNQLTADCVYKICDLLRLSWTPPPTTAPYPGTYMDGRGNVITITMIRKNHFATTTISKDLVATTTFTSTSPNDCTDPDGAHLSTQLSATERSSSIVNSSRVISSWQENPDFLSMLKMSLLDTVHGFYIDALGMLPSHALRERHLIRAVLAAGHCYGPLEDPVSNILLNSVWYDTAFPLSDDVSSQIGAADILDAGSMYHVESRSLDGLVAVVRHTHSVSEQQAVALLCEHRFNLSPMLQGPDQKNLASAALVAKHPQPIAFANFLSSLSPGELDRLHSLTSRHKGPGYVLSDDTLERLKKMVTTKTACIAQAAAVQTLDLDEYDLDVLSNKRSTFKSQQEYVRTVLQNLLLDYGNNQGHVYKLGIVCGVTTFRYGHTTCNHVNFLASTDVPDDSARSWALFFAEFWNAVDPRVEDSTTVPFCCPVRDTFDAYSICCYVCDHNSCRIAHPSSGEYAFYTGNDQPGFPVPYQWGADLSRMLECDYLYFDVQSDEFAKILSEESSSYPRKKSRAREELSSLSQRNTRAKTFAGHTPEVANKWLGYY